MAAPLWEQVGWEGHSQHSYHCPAHFTGEPLFRDVVLVKAWQQMACDCCGWAVGDTPGSRQAPTAPQQGIQRWEQGSQAVLRGREAALGRGCALRHPLCLLGEQGGTTQSFWGIPKFRGAQLGWEHPSQNGLIFSEPLGTALNVQL